MNRAISTELFISFLGIRLDIHKAEVVRFTINLITPDNGKKFIIEMENGTLTNLEGFLADKPDLTLTVNRSDLQQTMVGEKQLPLHGEKDRLPEPRSRGRLTSVVVSSFPQINCIANMVNFGFGYWRKKGHADETISTLACHAAHAGKSGFGSGTESFV